MSWPNQEHARLLAAATTAVGLVGELGARLSYGEVQHWQHTEMADRARALSEHLRSAVLLAQADAYPSSFALLRVALEHQLLDELIFHGRQHVQVYEGVTSAMWQEWQRARSEGADWTRDIIDWHWTGKRGGTVRVTRRGLYSEPDEDGHRLSMSVYYFLLREFDPLRPPRSEAETPFQGFPLKPEQAARLADHNKTLYETYLRWSSIRASLLGGGFFDSEAMSHLDVHYRFLSSYVHPLADRTAATYGRNADWPAYDHYASELVLLYVITLAVREIRSFMNFRSKITRLVVILTMAAGLLALGTSSASANSLSTGGTTTSTTSWNTGSTQYTQSHSGDDLAFDVTSGNAIDMRWISCNGSSTGAIKYNITAGESFRSSARTSSQGHA